jgi:amino acid permease
MREDKRREYTKERELELFYTKSSVEKLRLTGLVAGGLMPWIPFVVVLLALLLSNIYDYLMWQEFVFDPIGLFLESSILLIGSTVILAIIGAIAGSAIAKEKIRFFKTDIYISRSFLYFVLCFFVLMTPFGVALWIIDKSFSLWQIPGMLIISLILSFIGYPYWKALFNRWIYRLSDFDAVAEVEKEAREARSRQNVTREEEQETYRRFLEEMRKHR